MCRSLRRFGIGWEGTGQMPQLRPPPLVLEVALGSVWAHMLEVEEGALVGPGGWDCPQAPVLQLGQPRQPPASRTAGICQGGYHDVKVWIFKNLT